MSKVTCGATAFTSGNLIEPAAQDKISVLSFEKHKFELPAALRQHGAESPEASRKIPAVDGLAVPLTKNPLQPLAQLPLLPPALPPGILSALAKMFPAEQNGPSVDEAQSTIF